MVILQLSLKKITALNSEIMHKLNKIDKKAAVFRFLYSGIMAMKNFSSLTATVAFLVMLFLTEKPLLIPGSLS